jgi:hypothetical protein
LREFKFPFKSKSGKPPREDRTRAFEYEPKLLSDEKSEMTMSELKNGSQSSSKMELRPNEGHINMQQLYLSSTYDNSQKGTRPKS